MNGDKTSTIRSIRWKLMTTITLLMIGVLAVVTYSDILSQKHLMEDELDKRITLMKENLIERGKNFTKSLSQQVEKDIASFNFSGVIESVNNAVKGNKDIKYAILTDLSNTVYVHTLKPNLARSQLTGDADKRAVSQKAMSLSEYTEENQSVVEIIHPIQISVTPWGVFRVIFSLENLDKEIGASKSQIRNQIENMVLKACLTSLAVMIICFIIVLVLSSRFTSPLIQLTHSAKELALGDFTQTIRIDQKDEIGMLAKTMNQMVSSLSEIIRKNILTSQTLSDASSDQRASLEEVSALLEEMSSMTQQNAQNANQADALMKESNGVVSKANVSMNRLTTSMNEISVASKEIFKIVKTIDEIAFQTKMLALNASIEAARAGEAGAGFAVVAEEVKSLAMRSADAARNTANLIEETDRKVREGSGFVNNANEGFKEVEQNASEVATLVSRISQASNEQNQRIRQINESVNRMNTVTQRNAENAEELAASMSLFKVNT
ncbi:MAG TPA: hypothetical protein DCQ37_00215 [Desulfobacteraceae bacterium]|nr:hypothetical protein [Desulfobacteraceae bacterium]